MQVWFQTNKLGQNSQEHNAHAYAANIMSSLKEKTDEFFPLKTRNVSDDNKPFFSTKLAVLRRKKQREYNEHRKSEKWRTPNSNFSDKLKEAKKQYYQKEIANLKKSNPKICFYRLKGLISKNEANNKEIEVEEISHIPIKQQAEKIANAFSEVSMSMSMMN